VQERQQQVGGRRTRPYHAINDDVSMGMAESATPYSESLARITTESFLILSEAKTLPTQAIRNRVTK
jgi:hypothetical protein